MENFATTITCMDGRVQLPVNNYLRHKYQLPYIDTITLAGPSAILADGTNKELIQNIRWRIDISTKDHGSRNIALVGHYDCTAITIPDDEQKELVLEAARVVESWNTGANVLPLWVDEEWQVSEIKNFKGVNIK